MRISDWSSDVCSSDLKRRGLSHLRQFCVPREAEFTRVARAVIAAFFGDKNMRAFISRLPRRVVSGMMGATCVAALCAPAQAQVAPPFATLLRQTADAPQRIESEAEVRRYEGLARQARARPNPTIGVLTENVAGRSEEHTSELQSLMRTS